MKLGVLRSIGHNVADSLASGIGLMIGVYELDIFGEAKRAPDGFITVDFLAGRASGGKPSPELARAIVRYSEALSALCERHGTTRAAFRALSARFGTDRVYGPHFTVTIEDDQGRRTIDRYVGIPGARLRTYR